ncbi:MAG: cytochrome b N-terminal domain-containing protein [Gemmatimonadetes bacterium]|nr:cytochrome b N-terminal domain-containing protein [Gemmatimonadota bacterium]
MSRVLDWLDDRTGYRAIARAALYERIPGGARWRYVWGSVLTFALFVQFVTGVALWTAYSANAQGAWESVFYIQNQMLGGWVLRGIHHYMAQFMTVLLVLHLMQVVIDGAYRAPREINFWFGLILLMLVMGMSLTGYLLPWDQKGYWATKVATSIAAVTPVVGPALQRMLIGGAEYGHHTLTRFFAIHAGLLPLLTILLVLGHIYLFRYHGITPKKPARGPDARFWPDQLFRDAVAALALMAAVMFLVIWSGGAHLGAPADPTEPYAAARPEWSFMFLFQWLKYFPAGTEVIGAHVVPGLVLLVVALMPIIGRWRLGHGFNIGLLVALLLGVGLLTRQAYSEDARDPDFQLARSDAEATAARIAALAGSPEGIPAAGALSLLRGDPLTQGPRIFAANCASCHTYDGHDGLGSPPEEEPSASDLQGFASREWLEGLFDRERIGTPEYFGATAHRRGDMVRFVTRVVPTFERADVDRVIMALSAEAHLPYQSEADSAEFDSILEGRELLVSEAMRCTECHRYRGVGEEDPDGPVLTGYGSREWLTGMIRDPEHPDYYGEDNDGMPRFGVEESLTDEQIGLVADWLRQDWALPMAVFPRD